VSNRIYDFGFDYSSGDLVNLTGNFYSGTTTHEHVAGNGSAVTGALGPRVMETTSLGFNARNVSDFTWQGWDVTSTNGLEISRDGLGGNNGGSNPIDGEATRTAFFSENVLTSGALELMLGLRYSTYDLGYEDVSVSADSLDPKVSVAYQVNDWFQPYLSIYRTSRAPTLQEAFLGGDSGASHGGSMYNGNPELRPEVSTGYEIGANITRDGVLTAGDSLTARIAFYDMDVEDFILLSTAAGMQFVNADDTIATRGVEIEIGYESDRFSGVLSWAHTDGEYGAGRIQPEDAVTATLAAHMLDGALTVGTTWTYNSNGPAAIAFETEVDRDAYQVVDLFASYDITDTFSVNAKVSNVADELYTPGRRPRTAGRGATSMSAPNSASDAT
jgi:hemoglobin/transferrin/lactoferrin receptor protein